MSPGELLLRFLFGFATYFTLFLIFGGAGFAIFWLWGEKRFARLRIQPARRSASPFLRQEFRACLVTFVIFATGDASLDLAQALGHTRVYEEISQYGWSYFAGSIVMMVIIHDAWFYWSHRFLHLPFFYRHIHSFHHRSIDPSPFSSFSFHPLEAVVQWFIGVIFVFGFPTHLLALLAFQVWMTLMSVIGHLGYELYPLGWPERPIAGLFNTSTQHNLHHARGRGNYGLYFTWWDRLCGTERPDYRSEFAKLDLRRRPSPEGRLINPQI